MSGTLISSLAWIPRGRAAPEPKKYTLDEAEIERVGRLGGEGALEKLKEEMAEAMDQDGPEGWEDVDEGDDDDDDEDGEDEADGGDVKMDTDEAKPSDPNDLSAYKLDEYDQEESKGVAMGAFANVKGLSFYRDNNDDPYITLTNEGEDEDERDEMKILPTDALIVAARTTSDLSSLDVHVYDEANESLYVHHDLMLPAFPLCVEWLDFGGGSGSGSGGDDRPGSYVAIGSFDPAIEIWDADMVDGLYPHAILGPAPSLEKPEAKPRGTGKKKRRELVQPASTAEHHVQPVLALSWSAQHRHLLLSGSADATIKLWDLTRASPMPAARSWDAVHAGEKVGNVEWSPSTGDMGKAVLSAGERTVKVWDSRAADDAVGIRLGSDVECVRWDPWEPASFFVSLENGLILAYDSRVLSSQKLSDGLSSAQAKYTLSAHDGGAAALDVNPHIRGCIVTGGMDKTVKVWNVCDEETEGVKGRKREISLATSRDLGLGKVFTARWAPDPETPLTLAAAGSKAVVQVWDVASNAGARKAFGDRLRRHGRELGAVKKGGGVVVANGGDEDEED